MIDKKYDDICFVEGFEVVPQWKRCAEYSNDWDDDQKELWNYGYDHHGEYTPTDVKKFENKYWYMWKDYKCGSIFKHEDDSFVASMREVMTGWSSPHYTDIEGALYYIIACYYAKKAYSYKVNDIIEKVPLL